MFSFLKKKRNKSVVSMTDLISSVKQVALEDGSDYFSVQVCYGSSGEMVSGNHQDTKNVYGIYFKAYTIKSGWVYANSIESLCEILRTPPQKGITSEIKELKIDFDAQEV